MYIDKRIFAFLMAIMLCINVAVLLNAWPAIIAGGSDFPIFYSNAQMVREGYASGLYNFDAEHSFTRRVTDIPRPPNNHLPYELLLFIPFTYLRFGPANILWMIVSLAMLAGVAAIIQNLGGKWKFYLTFLLIFAFFPEWYCLIAGQDSILLLLLFTISFWLWKTRKDDVAGFVMALGLFRPQIVLPFIFVAFLAGKWKFVRGLIPGAALVVALSAWVVGMHGMADYARILLSQGTQKSDGVLSGQWQVRPGLMPTWRGFLWLCLPRWGPPKVQTVLLLSGTILGLGWAAKKLRAARSSGDFDVGFAIALATVVLVSFHSFLQDFSLTVLPLLICTSAFTVVKVVPKSAYLTVGLCFLLFSTPLYLLLFSTRSLGLLFPIQAVALWLASRWETVSEATLDAVQLPKSDFGRRSVDLA